MKVKEYVKKILAAFKARDVRTLRKLDDIILREASLIYSKKLYYLAVVSYVLSKILSKSRFIGPAFKAKIKAIEKCLDDISLCEEECTDEEFYKHFAALEETIKNLEVEDPRFIIGLFSKGQLKAAATLYAQGISLGMASEITGVEKQQILSYAGHTMMFDRVKEETKVKDRLKALRDLVRG